MENRKSGEYMKVGYYVRTKKGIAKYLGLGRDVLKHETNKGTYEHYYNQHLFDNYVFDVGHDYEDTLIYDEFNNIDKLGKVKENIIDLIEVGDYVNGERVINIIKKHKYLEVSDEEIIIDEKDIKSIVTKEQFESIEYKVKE